MELNPINKYNNQKDLLFFNKIHLHSIFLLESMECFNFSTFTIFSRQIEVSLYLRKRLFEKKNA